MFLDVAKSAIANNGYEVIILKYFQLPEVCQVLTPLG